MSWLRMALVAVAVIASQTAVSGQTDNRLAVGGAVGIRASGRSDATGALDPVFIWRIGHDGPGWGIRYGFNWYQTDLEQTLTGEGALAPFGRLHVRPILVGYGYRFAVGRATTVSANIKGGYAFSSFSLKPAFAEGYQAALGVPRLEIDPHNTFVVKPEVSAWIDLSRKIGLNITGGYMIARPRIALSSAAGVERRRLDADMFMMNVGVVYSVF